MIDVSTDALDWIVRESAIPYTKMTPHIKETRTRITRTPNRSDIACAAIFTPRGRNVNVLTYNALHPADMMEEMAR